jgi:uncharacterized protein (DUF433 family)
MTREYTAPMPLDWSQCSEVTRAPDVMGGAWVFKGTRLPVANVFENLEAGLTVAEIPELFQGITVEQVRAVLHFAAASLHDPALAS